ncbi:MAG: FixH family protein [Moraxellaceae bacterium]
MHNEQPLSAEKPWYRQFWPWFIMALPASAVVAGIGTVIIAVKYQDALVRDDWYKEGRAINQNMARDEAAQKLGIVAAIRMDALTGEVNVSLQENSALAHLPAQLQMVLSHPTQAEADQHLVLLKRPDGQYHGQLQQALQGRFDIELGDAQWRLLSSRTFPLNEFSLRHE